MSASDYLENKILDHILGGPDFTRPANVYIALSTTAPNDDGTNFTEPSGGSYSRVAMTNDATNWPAASGGVKANGVEIVFPEATADWGTVTHFGIFDAATGGNLLFHGALTVARTITTGDTPKFLVNSFKISAD